MKTFNDPNDPLARSLIEDAGSLALAAAKHARSRRQAHIRTTRLAILICLPLIMIGVLKLVRTDSPPNLAGSVPLAAPPVRSASVVYLTSHSVSVPAGSKAISEGISGREKQILTELPDAPLLIVRNRAGEVSRVHVFERR